MRSSNLHILDESTANLGHTTDLTIQSTIREEIGMRHVPVLCIVRGSISLDAPPDSGFLPAELVCA